MIAELSSMAAMIMLKEILLVERSMSRISLSMRYGHLDMKIVPAALFDNLPDLLREEKHEFSRSVALLLAFSSSLPASCVP